MKKPKTTAAICILSTHERSGWHHPSITEWLCNLQHTEKEIATGAVFAKNFQPAAYARNIFFKSMKDSDAEWLGMIDNDMEIPNNLLDCLRKAPKDADVIVPQFFMWDGKINGPKLCWSFPDDSPAVQGDKVGIEPDKFYSLRTCGTGVIFVKRSLVNKMEAPWFHYTYDELGQMTGTEDIQFALKLDKLGAKIYGYGGVVCGHDHTVDIARVAELAYRGKWVDKEETDSQDVNHGDDCDPVAPREAEARPA